MNYLLGFLSMVMAVMGSRFDDGIDFADLRIAPQITPIYNCVSFTVSAGTGCEWMCDYCRDKLGTNNYYFTDGICHYETDGCVGNPLVGPTYTCCAASISYTTYDN